MIRVVLTVALAVAVLATVAPAVERAAVSRADASVSGAASELVSTARALAADSDALAPGVSGARRVVALRLPVDSPTSAGLAFLRIGPPGARGAGTAGEGRRATTRISWRVRGGTEHVRQVDGVRLRSPDRQTDRAVTVRSGGTTRFTLELVRVDGRRVVWVRRHGRE